MSGEWIDGITSMFMDSSENPFTISGAFDSIKDTFNEILLFIYYIYFFVVFIIFLVLAIGLYVALPIWLVDKLIKNYKTINKLLNFKAITPKSK